MDQTVSGRFSYLSPTVIAVALSFVAPLSIDAILPSFEKIRLEFGATLADVQGVLSSYLLAYGLMSLWHGILADALGRRVTAIASLSLYAIASIGCAYSGTLQLLEVSRFVQGAVAGSGVVVARAIVRDLFRGVEAQRRLSIISMMLALPPALGPIAGGWLVYYYRWQVVFLVLAVLALILLIICIWRLPETQAETNRIELNFGSIFRSYAVVLSNRKFQLLIGAATLCLAGQFLTIAGAPLILVGHFAGSELDYWRIFIPITSGVFIGGLLSARLAGAIGAARQVNVGFLLMITSALADLLLAVSASSLQWWTFCPYLFYAIGMVLLIPVAYAQTLDDFPKSAGVVASCQLFAQSAAVMIVSGVLVPALGSFFALTAGKIALTFAALFLWLLGILAINQEVPNQS
jgi:DHA1 family bicyclomycin/chloramphenicol resistance-like MFS transporter